MDIVLIILGVICLLLGLMGCILPMLPDYPGSLCGIIAIAYYR